MRAFIEIDINALENNYLKIKNETKKDIIAVLKDNAYGHGLIECAYALYKLKVPMFAVSTKEEAITIRKNLIFTPILLLGECHDIRFLSSYKITQTIISFNQLKLLAKSSIPIPIHLFIDIGMKREGIEIDEIDEALQTINNSKLVLKGICTHYSSLSNYENEHILFLDALKKIPNYQKLIIHSSASSTYKINKDDTAYRIGLSLFGLDNELEPVLKLKSPIIRKIKVNKGTPISYDGIEITPEDGYIYTIGLGYGDGWRRNYKTTAYIKNDQLKQIGVTCMDYMMLYSKNNYDENVILSIIDECHSANEIANENNTIVYEITSLLNQRLKRKILKK